MPIEYIGSLIAAIVVGVLALSVYVGWVRNRFYRAFQQKHAEPWQSRHRAHRGGI